jgi:hypothetical protein
VKSPGCAAWTCGAPSCAQVYDVPLSVSWFRFWILDFGFWISLPD